MTQTKTQNTSRLQICIGSLLAISLAAPMTTGAAISPKTQNISKKHTLVPEGPSHTPEVSLPSKTVEDTEKKPLTHAKSVCETFVVIEGDTRIKNKHGKWVYPVRYKRNRYKRTRKDLRRTQKLIRLVAKEMGADESGQYLVDMIARHESSWNPEAIHILNRDLTANLEAWEKHSYNPELEHALLQELEQVNAKQKRYWEIKAKLADLRLYKDNPFWNTQMEFLHKIPERTLHGETTPPIEFKEKRSVWSYGYGLYGMNAVLFTYVWDRNAPPWVLCDNEGIIATITAIWTLREHQKTCSYLSKQNPEKYGTDGGSARGVVHRFARGHCSDKRLGKVWQKLMAQYAEHVDWDVEPYLGDKFPRYKMKRKNGKWVYDYAKERDTLTGEIKRDEKGRPIYKRDSQGRKVKQPTDREEILAHMLEKAEKAGLLRTKPLEHKNPNVVVASIVSDVHNSK